MTTTETWSTHESQFWLRGERPAEIVTYVEELGYWQVFGHPEIEQILRDPATFSSDTMRLVPEEMRKGGEFEGLNEGNLLQMDPPLHNKMRKLVSRAFTPKVVADLEPRIATIATELLEQIEGEQWELVADLAYPLPVIVIAELLGVPASDRNLFKQWVDKMFDSNEQISLKDTGEKQDKKMRLMMEQQQHLADYLGEHVDDRRTHPRDDLITKLVEAELDGQKLTRNEVINFSNVLLLAGHITTTMLLGNTVLCLDANPEEAARTRADRSRLPAVIEESLRFLTPFASMARSTTKDVELGGVTIPADQMVMISLAAANRDERVFENPNVFDGDRDPNPHLAFGRGVHFCIGAPLARLEGRVALNLLFDRFPALRTIPGKAPLFQVNPNMTGVRELHLSSVA